MSRSLLKTTGATTSLSFFKNKKIAVPLKDNVCRIKARDT